MAKLFEQGDAKQTVETQPSVINQGKFTLGAELLKQFNNQSFGGYLQSGPQGIPQGALNQLLGLAQNPQNFYGRTITSGHGMTPSTFEEIGSVLGTLLLLNKLTGSDPNILTGAAGSPTMLGRLWDWVTGKQHGAGDTAAKSGTSSTASPTTGGPQVDPALFSLINNPGPYGGQYPVTSIGGVAPGGTADYGLPTLDDSLLNLFGQDPYLY